MAKILKQSFDSDSIVEKKHSLRFDADKDEAKKLPLSSIYVSKKALEKAGVKVSRVKNIEVQITVHEGK